MLPTARPRGCEPRGLVERCVHQSCPEAQLGALATRRGRRRPSPFRDAMAQTPRGAVTCPWVSRALLALLCALVSLASPAPASPAANPPGQGWPGTLEVSIVAGRISVKAEAVPLAAVLGEIARLTGAHIEIRGGR